MKRIMRQRFVPGHYQRELHSKLKKLTQGSRTVEEYYQEMEIQDIVEMQNCVALESMFHKAVLAETQLKRRSSTRLNTEPRRPAFNRDTKSFAPRPETKPLAT
ncbi:unnamed protein product [Microthlaspi erraticum]|uniref:Retrotransposon gag domain-containing protein n=1 Tax=Microthlaspi erraticum TaxID=1685480 RepID=A0A6D2JG16_9BRAS|nr:unnamed protein product [Microthlaspi erraticum]